MEVFGVPPKGSGLPELPTPSSRLNPPFRRILLLFALDQIKKRPSGDISRRVAQQAFNRGGGSLVSKHLNGLVAGDWLAVRKESKGVYARCYGYGSRLTWSQSVKADWDKLSSSLFGPEGLLVDLFESPAKESNFLGTNGLFIASTLMRSSRSLTHKEISEYLEYFMSRQSVDNVLKKLGRQDPALAINENGKWSIPDDFADALDMYELLSGATSRSERNIATSIEERVRHGIRVKGGLLTPADEREIKGNGCIRCHTHKPPIQIEHFPPKKYGGYDHIDLCWGICGRCNWKYSNFIRKHSAPKLAESIRLALNEGIDPKWIVLASLEVRLRQFYSSVDRGLDEQALNHIASAFSLWKAVIEGTIPIRITRTNERGLVPPTFSFSRPVVRKKTGEIGKRYKSSQFIPDWAKGPAKELIEPWKTWRNE